MREIVIKITKISAENKNMISITLPNLSWLVTVSIQGISWKLEGVITKIIDWMSMLERSSCIFYLLDNSIKTEKY